MFGRYELIVADSNNGIIFQGCFQSINRLSKTLSCFSAPDLKYSVVDIVLDRHYSAYELKKVFQNEYIVL